VVEQQSRVWPHDRKADGWKGEPTKGPERRIDRPHKNDSKQELRKCHACILGRKGFRFGIRQSGFTGTYVDVVVEIDKPAFDRIIDGM
jgi:hypothetical protein